MKKKGTPSLLVPLPLSPLRLSRGRGPSSSLSPAAAARACPSTGLARRRGPSLPARRHRRDSPGTTFSCSSMPRTAKETCAWAGKTAGSNRRGLRQRLSPDAGRESPLGPHSYTPASATTTFQDVNKQHAER